MRDYYKVYGEEEWFKEYLKRLEYQRKKDIPFEESGIPFWPKKEEICHEEHLDVKPQCLIPQDDPTIDYLSFGTKKYGINNILDATNKYLNNPIIPKLYEKFYN